MFKSTEISTLNITKIFHKWENFLKLLLSGTYFCHDGSHQYEEFYSFQKNKLKIYQTHNMNINNT